MDETLIDRGEVVALLFNVSDISLSLKRIEKILQEDDDDGEEEADSG
jgi:hypothetical protein